VTSPDEVTSQLARSPAWIAGLLGSVPPQDLKRRPRPGKWSAHEHACHLAVMEPMWASRLELILRENHPTIVSYEPDADDPDRLLNMDLRSGWPTSLGAGRPWWGGCARCRSMTG
jgi:hypothetical protein